jgi:hypothetical protein
MSPLSDEYYRVQLTEGKISWAIIASIIILTLITVVIVVSVIRSRYITFLSDPNIGTSFAYMCAFSHVYPFLAPLFFKNPNTPDIAINIYYFMQSFGSNPAPWGPNAPCPNCWQALVVPDNWRDAVNSIVWYSESNANYGYDQVLTWAQSAAVGLIATTPPSTTGSLVSGIFAYGLPLLNTAIMLLGLFGV